jgi:uncharacterized protein DUF4349
MEPAGRRARPTGMNATAATGAFRGPLRTTRLAVGAVICGTGLLLAGCSGSSGSSASSGSSGSSGSSASFAAPQPIARAAAPGAANAGGGQPAAAQATRLIPSSQSIVYTAGLSVKVKDVTAAAGRAVALARAAGGYTSSERQSLTAGDRKPAVVSLQLKIPVAQYAAVLGQLSALGTQTSMSQQAQDVTQQVADVSSRVTSAQAAITQLRALLRRAGSVSGLLGVQDQINAQESALEALLAQQRALAHETADATVSLRLTGHHLQAVKEKKDRHGFAAGLSAGWHALRLVVSGLLTGLGALLPFALIAALAAGIFYGGRRRVLRRRSRPTAAQ